jgi:hypothetical protein
MGGEQTSAPGGQDVVFLNARLTLAAEPLETIGRRLEY